MKINSRIRVVLLLTLSSASLFAQPKKAALLPDGFAGWTLEGKAVVATDPASVDAAQSAVLKEYGFTDSSRATYVNGDNKLTVKAARFKDASGAYGAFTFYRQTEMKTESIGTMAASANERLLFFKTNVLVEAHFERLTAMSAAALRELAAALPAAEGTAATLPTLPNYFPRQDMVTNSARYILGPVAYAGSGLHIPQETVAFNKGAEVLTARVHTDAGEADFTVVNYPTPQLAMERVKAFEASNPKDQNATYAVRRSGPMVAVVSGAISEKNARTLLGLVNYEAEVTWNQNTMLSKRDNIGNLVIGAITLAFILFMISLATGTIFTFRKVFLRKILPARFAPKEEQAEFIRLRLED